MIIETEASDELLAAAVWYDDQHEGLGGEFLGAVDAVLLRVAEEPMSFMRDRARRALVPRFPYAIVFVMHDGEVRIVACAHTKRLPGYWTRRV